MDVKIEASWKEALSAEFQKPYFNNIVAFLKTEKEGNKKIFPPGSLIFNAFEQTPFYNVKVVLLGQDPYHNHGQAHGLCFSVPQGIAFPPSLQNIFKEIKADIGIPIPSKADLTYWAKQGVLLLNASLTVRAHEANSHARIGWSDFTHAVIKKLSDEKEGIIFLLWGRFAQEKEALVDTTKHHVLKAAHPSPLSAHNGFFGCKHFSKTNELLSAQGKTPIDWKVD